MKKSMLILLILLTGTCFFSSSAFAGWVLYDNFNSGRIDPALWDIDDSSADISVVGRKVKFMHKLGHPGDSAWLYLKDPRGVKGIRATVRITKSKGNCRARVGAEAGKIGKRRFWQATEIRPNDKWINGMLGAEVKRGGQWIWKGTSFWGHFGDNMKVVKKTFKIGIDFFDLNNIHFYANRFGEMAFDPKIRLRPITKRKDMFLGIGTRSNDDAGSMTVTFDNVYVYMDN